MERPQKRERTALEKKRKFRAEENRKNQKELAQIFFVGVEPEREKIGLKN